MMDEKVDVCPWLIAKGSFYVLNRRFHRKLKFLQQFLNVFNPDGEEVQLYWNEINRTFHEAQRIVFGYLQSDDVSEHFKPSQDLRDMKKMITEIFLCIHNSNVIFPNKISNNSNTVPDVNKVSCTNVHNPISSFNNESMEEKSSKVTFRTKFKSCWSSRTDPQYMMICKELDHLSIYHSYESVGLKLILRSDEFTPKAFIMKFSDNLHKTCFEILPRSCIHCAGLNEHLVKCSKMLNHEINSVMLINGIWTRCSNIERHLTKLAMILNELTFTI
ncbi:unnamed protein product, partial [Meganyctiphanes norvegica]